MESPLTRGTGCMCGARGRPSFGQRRDVLWAGTA
jgi:hypothetical protein